MTYQQGFLVALNRCMIENPSCGERSIKSYKCNHSFNLYDFSKYNELNHLEGIDWYIDLTSSYGKII